MTFEQHCHLPEREDDVVGQVGQGAPDPRGVLLRQLRARREAGQLGDPRQDLQLGGRIAGLALSRPDGAEERIACRALVLACNGFGGNRALVRRHTPEMAEALYFGHPGNEGDALVWGEALGAATRHLSGYQGHGSVAHPHGILITWATITEGGVQVSAVGRRFCDETQGYSEAAAQVLAQPGGIAWTVFDGRIAGIARQFEDFRAAEAASAILTAQSWEGLAAAMSSSSVLVMLNSLRLRVRPMP